MLNRLSVAKANTSQIKTRLLARFCLFVCVFVFFRKKTCNICRKAVVRYMTFENGCGKNKG